MEWIAVSLIVSAAYVYAPLLRMHAARLFGVSLPAGVVTPEASALVVPPKPVKLVELPEAVESWCSGWYDEATQNEQRNVARELYSQSSNWDSVLMDLERLSGGSVPSDK